MKDNNLLQYLSPTDTKSQNEEKGNLLQFLPDDTQATQIRANVLASSSISPELATKQYNLSKQTNIPIQAVRTRENEIMKRTEFDSINYDDLVNNFPKVAQQLYDPAKAAAIRDDVSNLSYFEKLTGSVKQEYQLSQQNVDNADIGLKRMFFEVTGQERHRLSPLEENSLELAKQTQTKDYGLGFVSSIPSYTASAIPTILATIPQTLGGAVVGGGIGALAGPEGIIPGATFGSKAGVAFAAGKLETAGAYDEFRNFKSQDGKPIEPQVAAGAAITTGIVNGMLELVPFEEATGQIKKAFTRGALKEVLKTGVSKELFKNIGKLALAEGTTEALQEFSTVAFGEVAKAASTGDFAKVGMKDANDSEGLINFLSATADRVMQSFEAGAGAGIGLGLATGGVNTARQVYENKAKGKVENQEISTLVEKIKESKTFTRDPELFKEVTKDTLGEKNVYMSAESVQTFFQSKTPEEIEKINQAIPEIKDQLQEAIDVGGNVVLPANSILTAVAQYPELSELQGLMSLSPESLNQLEAENAFMQDVVPTVHYEEQNQKVKTEQDAVKKNIETQILNLGMPYRDAKDLISTVHSYYDTKLARYGSGEASKVLNKYLGGIELKNAPFEAKPFSKIEDLDLFLDQARNLPTKKAGKPLFKFLKEKGGVKIGSNLAAELKAIGVNTKNAPALFRKDTGLGDVDNIPASEFRDRFPNVGSILENNGYVDQQTMLDLLNDEVKGKDITRNQEELDDFLEELNKMGVDINTKTNQEIKQIIENYNKKEVYSQDEETPRGQTQFIGQKPIITLFEGKNRSTVLHELGHVFLQIEKDIAILPDISEQIKEDWKTIEKWLGIKDGKITVEAHEKFARGFEAYLFEGKAPSIALRDAFSRFKAWLVRVYKDISQLNVKLNEDVRSMFDRMLATDEAIENLKDNPVFRVDDNILDLLTATEKKDYLNITQRAGEKAKEKLLKKALKQKAIANKEFYQKERAAVKKEIEEEMNKNPTYRAIHYLKTGKLLGEETAIEAFKLDKKEVKQNYNNEFIKYLPKDIFGKNSVSTEAIAEIFGFKDGGEMLYSIANAGNFKEELNKSADAEMIRRYGDMLFDGTIENEALDASQSEARANKILYELNAANRKVKTFTQTKEAYKQKAKETIAKKQVRDATQTNIFYLQEIKAAREASKALGKKDYETAVQWKERQLLNHYLFRESLELKSEVQKALRSYAKIKKVPKVGKVKIEEDYRLRALNILQDFNLAKKSAEYVKTNINDLEAWKKEQAENGVLGLVEFPELSEFQDKDNIKNLTTEQFRTLDDAIQNLVHTGRDIRMITINGKRQELNSIVDKIIEQANTNIKKNKPEIEDPTDKQKLIQTFDSFASSLIKTSQTTLKIDGEKSLGKFYDYFEKDLNDAELVKNQMADESYEKLDEIFKKYFGGYKITEKKTFFPAVGKSYSKKAVLAFALNWGTEINQKRIKDGFNYTDAQVTSIISSLNSKELSFVQDIWDLVNSYWSKIEETEKKLFGISPKKQNSKSFDITASDGEKISMKGGYYPLSYTAESNFKSDTAEDLKNVMLGSGFDKVNFHKSFTKSRTQQEVNKKIVLDLNPLTKHLTEVITDISMKPAAWNAYRIINNRRLKSVLVKKIGIADYKQLQSWVYDMYGRTLIQEGFIGKFAGLSRSITTTYAMGFKVATALIQITGLTQSAVKLGYKNTGVGIWKALGNGNPTSINKSNKLAYAKSKILKDRSKTINREIYEVINRLQKANKFQKSIAKYAFYAITKAQMLVDIPTWYGGYYKGLEDFNGDDKKAVEFADRTLIETQGSSLKQARSMIERDEAAIVKAFTVFYSYMNVKLNLAVGSYRGSNFRKPKDVAKFIADVSVLFIADAAMTEFLRTEISTLLSSDDSDDDDENKALHYANLMGGSIASSIPIASQIYSGLSGFSFNPSGFRGVEIVGKGVGKLGNEALKAINPDEEADLIKALRGLNDTLSIFTVGGGGQIDIFLKALADQNDGENVAPIDYIMKKQK